MPAPSLWNQVVYGRRSVLVWTIRPITNAGAKDLVLGCAQKPNGCAFGPLAPDAQVEHQDEKLADLVLDAAIFVAAANYDRL